MKRVLLLLMCFALALISACNETTPTSNPTIRLYYLTSDASKMAAEERIIETGEGGDLLTSVINELLKGPSLPEHKRAIPQNSKLLGVEMDGNIAIINLSEEFDVGTDVERLWARYTLINTVCSLDGVDKAKILINGTEITSFSSSEPLGALGKDDIVVENIKDRDNTIVTLYFSDKEAMYLVPENRNISIKDGEKLEQVVVTEIIKGPNNKELSRTVTSDVKVISVETKEGICFLNLSQEFLTKNTGGSTKERFAVYSIVNTLCEIYGIDKVQFLIEGQKIDVFGQLIFNEPITKDDSLLN